MKARLTAFMPRGFLNGLPPINRLRTKQIGGNVNGATNHIQKENIDH